MMKASEYSSNGISPIYAYRRVNEALALKPDIIMLAVDSLDVQQDINPELLATETDRAGILHRVSTHYHQIRSSTNSEYKLSISSPPASRASTYEVRFQRTPSGALSPRK